MEVKGVDCRGGRFLRSRSLLPDCAIEIAFKKGVKQMRRLEALLGEA